MLCQIPGISSASALAILSQFKTLPNLIKSIQTDETSLNNICTTDPNGKFRKISKFKKFDYVFLTSLQKIDKALVFFGTPFQNVIFSGIYLGAKFHLYKYGIFYESRFNYLSKKFFQKLLKISTLQNIITNDHLLRKYVQSQKWIAFNKLKFFHDPKEFNFSFNKSFSKKKLGIPRKSILILAYGALIESKGIIELLSIFKDTKLNKEIRVILAGKQFGKNKNFLLYNNFINKLILEKKLFIFNCWIDEKKEALLFSINPIPPILQAIL